ncbi:phosphate/phosphite/phosphonate ABC transporter substrate-binding protein [Staphylococcus sp. GDX8P54P]|uniref:phosphate/phosphite/phosphonate ABC transporter substrate-binding protein n=1 Tax=Staphylococcus sp. GDX8P54P TaxID=2804099 RepID=UPI001AEC303B|nr:phosphate/phosphite/phosphonate ABC transporter substrate-binding protein [Staphylococcus sp. GDX8P54P]
MKKIIVLFMSFIVLVVALSGCSPKEDKRSDDYKPETLNVEFVPSQNAKTLDAKVKPLQQLLSKELGIPVKVHIATNYNTMVEALKSKKVDVAFISPVSYTIAHDQGAADVLLKSKGYLVDDKGHPTSKLVDYYRSQIVVRQNSHLQTLEDLKGKKVGLQDPESTSGYIYPMASLKKVHIHQNDIKIAQIKGHDQALIALLNGDVDAVAIYQDARTDLKRDYPNIYKDTKVIYRTEKIPNDTISVRSDMNQQWKTKISNAFLEMSKTKKGKTILTDIYGHQGYEKAKDSDFDTVRKYRKLVEE